MASNSKKKSRDNHGDDDESVDESPARETKRRRNHTLRENVDHDDHEEEGGEPPARQRRRRNEEDDTTPTIQSFQNQWDAHLSSSSSAMRIGTAAETPSILFDPNHNRGDLESLRQLMALSFANSLTQSTFPGLYSSPINSLSALSMLPHHQQQLSSYNHQPVTTRMPQYENALGGWNPLLLRAGLTYNDPLASAMTMANLQRMQLANGLYGAPLLLQSSAAAAALAAARSSIQPGLPGNFCFASRSVATTAPNRNEPVANDARQLSNSGASLFSSCPTKRGHRPKTSHPHLGIPLFIEGDHSTLNDQQIFLRKHIEFFRATQDDILSHTRGKNKPIFVKQVGIRCIHCSYISVGRRQKGSTYFPSSLMGIYQAAQNLSVEHLQSGLCPATPADIKKRFIKFASTKPAASGAGKKYWAEAGRMLGLVDTEEGIRFAADVT